MDGVTRGELNRTTLQRQSLLERSNMAVGQAIEHLVGLQAQNPSDPYWALWSRIEGFDPKGLSRMIAQGEAVRGQLMRATIHLVTNDDYVTLRPLLQPVLSSTLGSTAFARESDGVDREALLSLGRSLLARHPMTRAELGPLLAARFPGVPGASLAQVVTYLLPVVQVPPRGLWQESGAARWATFEDWSGSELSSDGEVGDLVMRYLAAFGPASTSDIRVWSGLPGLRQAVEALRPGLRVYRDERGAELLDHPDLPIVDERTPAPPRFLPEYDNVLLGHSDRSRFFPDGVVPLGWMGNLLVDGAFSGAWKSSTGESRSRLEITLLRAVSNREQEAVQVEGERLLGFASPGMEKVEIVIHSAR